MFFPKNGKSGQKCNIKLQSFPKSSKLLNVIFAFIDIYSALFTYHRYLISPNIAYKYMCHFKDLRFFQMIFCFATFFWSEEVVHNDFFLLLENETTRDGGV